MCYMWVFAAASAALSAYGQVQQGQAQAQAETYNAEVATRNAQAAEEEQANVADAAAIERRRLGERVRAERGEQVAKFSAMGVDPAFGTPADLVGDIEQAYRADRDIIGRNEVTALSALDKQIADYKGAASLGQASAKSAIRAGQIAAGGSLLDGVGNVASRWITPSATTTKQPSASVISTGRKIPVGGG